MSKLFIYISVFMTLSLVSCGNCTSDCNQEPIQQASTITETVKNGQLDVVDSIELSAIRNVLDLYVKAAIKGDSRIAQPAFAPAATMSYAEGDSLVTVPIKALFDYYDNTGSHPASYEIAACRVVGDVAIVQIESKFGETEFADMFTLVKDGTGWKIVSKVYHVK